MKNMYLSDLKRKELIVHPVSIGYYKMFNHLILPFLSVDDIDFWTRIQCSQIIQGEKQSSKTYLFYDKFFILDHCFTTDVKDINVYKSELNFSFSKKFTDQQIKSFAFNEIVFFITRYKSVLNLVECYEQLKNQLSENDCIQMFDHIKLTTKIFINLIGLSETSYHNSRCKTHAKESYSE